MREHGNSTTNTSLVVKLWVLLNLKQVVFFFFRKCRICEHQVMGFPQLFKGEQFVRGGEASSSLTQLLRPSVLSRDDWLE